MTAELLICALALPPALPPMPEGYKMLVGFIKSHKPGYEIVFVNRDEKLNGKSQPTPVVFKGLRVWLVRSGA